MNMSLGRLRRLVPSDNNGHSESASALFRLVSNLLSLPFNCLTEKRLNFLDLMVYSGNFSCDVK